MQYPGVAVISAEPSCEVIGISHFYKPADFYGVTASGWTTAARTGVSQPQDTHSLPKLTDVDMENENLSLLDTALTARLYIVGNQMVH